MPKNHGLMNIKQISQMKNHWTWRSINIQYWCIDGNIEFMWRGLETGDRTSFSESFHPFRAEPHKFYIYRQYTNIVFILQ